MASSRYEERFWQKKCLEEMTETEWELLCDRCGKCCLVKLEDADTEQIYFTDVACQFMDQTTCQCSDYNNRSKVKDCVKLDPGNIMELSWLPSSCSYKLVANGVDLPSWHHLISGSEYFIHSSGASIKGRVISEQCVKDHDLEDHIIRWVD
jgi:uncharacterized cysteine cluster protein YcgN (CxxCxxCC family)